MIFYSIASGSMRKSNVMAVGSGRAKWFRRKEKKKEKERKGVSGTRYSLQWHALKNFHLTRYNL